MRIPFKQLLVASIGCAALCLGCGLEGIGTDQTGQTSTTAQGGSATTGVADESATSDGSTDTATTPPTDRSNLGISEALQGTWKITDEGLPTEVRSSYNRYYIFSGDRMESRIERKVMQSGTFQIDTTRSPPVIVTKLQRMTGRNPGPPLESDMLFELLEGNTKLKIGEKDFMMTLEFVR